MPEPQLPPGSAEAIAAADPALHAGPAAQTDGQQGPDSPALLPQILAAILGLVAAALAFRQVTLRSRSRPPAGRRPHAGRHAPGGRHARTGSGPGQDQDPDRASPVPLGPRPAASDPRPAASDPRPAAPDPGPAPPDPGRAGSRRP
jgi:hypothetical protein